MRQKLTPRASSVMVAPTDLPDFWIFVYRAFPLTYLMDGLISAGLANTKIACSATEMLSLSPPSGFSGTCDTYLSPFYQSAGGSLSNPDASSNCQYCTFSETNALLERWGISTSSGWNNLGYRSVFVIFNVFATFLLYWVARIPHKRKQ